MLHSESTNRNPIRILPRELAEKIAAGEVVERPGSVIKELVENAIDALATSIQVDLTEGGKKRIVVRDNGHGIPNAEVLTALERHATSKIQELDDLWNLSTMGFRGEALPSIAAVSRFTLETKYPGEPGRLVYLEGSRILRDETLGPQIQLQLGQGTRITIEDLFYNVPARLKFLKAKSGESVFIRELIERIALSHPSIAFTLTSEGRKTLDLPVAKTASERVAAVLEASATDIEEFESIFENTRVRGWLDRNTRAHHNRYVYLSVNGRMVRDRLLHQAVLIGLRPRMMEGEYPKIYLAIEVPPGDVDVNVHPAKSEVRFRNSRDVFQFVHRSLEKIAQTPTTTAYKIEIPASMSTPLISAREPEPLPAELFVATPSVFKTKVDFKASEPVLEFSAPEPQKTPAPKAQETPGFQQLHYIGQVKNTYLLFQDNDGLIVIDQHAAHERIQYEKIKAEFFASGLRPQPLLMSITVKCKSEDVALALDHDESIQKLGFEFEAFGEDCLVLRAIPEQLEQQRAAELFRALLDDIRDTEAGDFVAKDPSRLSPKLERALATQACHSSVRAGQSLSPQEARALSVQMDETNSSLNCPHGRPASIRLSFSQIEGFFKR